jgi:hypothetical protein
MNTKPHNWSCSDCGNGGRIDLALCYIVKMSRVFCGLFARGVCQVPEAAR